ncbi:DUF3514 domain-containing protein [Ehrlichia chaffeensis]|uniref:DUF3514 domain-containing protein n=1 Tax=Ehrlichia chaffeensis TaxID=945 RepID=UPI000444E1AE|nr:DUF3514 domain-containing protein [Ehrlichia chaffeensis]AHX06016.1 hypothetical protein ECHJAX_0970 [Ehrlichia chaffeensis str. Jax]
MQHTAVPGMVAPTSVISAKHVVIKGLVYKHVKHYSIEEYKSQIKEFRESIACFARMHMSYMYHMLHNTFVVRNGRIMLKSEIEQCLSKITSNIRLCAFVIKIGIVDHVMSRLCRFYGSDSIKYCASHYHDPRVIDLILIGLYGASYSDFSRMSYQVRSNIVYCVGKHGIAGVFKLHNSGFYSELLGMCYDFVHARGKGVKLQELCDFMKLSCSIQLGQMYHMMVKVKCSIGDEQSDIRKLVSQECSVGYLVYRSLLFGRYAYHVRKAFRHLYAPSDKNPVRTVSGLNIPHSLIRLNHRGIFTKIEHCINAEKMSFNVFVVDIVRHIDKLLLHPREEVYIREDISTYCAIVSSRYSTMGPDIDSSYHIL